MFPELRNPYLSIIFLNINYIPELIFKRRKYAFYFKLFYALYSLINHSHRNLFNLNKTIKRESLPKKIYRTSRISAGPPES